MHKIVIFIVAVLTFSGLLTPESRAEVQQPSSNPLSLGAQIYKQRFEEIQSELHSCRQTLATCQQPKTAAENAYTQRSYAQETEMREVELAIYRWQIWAANVVLALMGLLTVSAVVFCGYQLWRGQQLSKLPSNLIEMELSVSKLKLQTSVVGIAVLVAAYGFLIVFTREIYQLRSVEQRPVAKAASALSAPEPDSSAQ